MAPRRASSPAGWALRLAAAWLALVALLLCRNVTIALLPAAFFLLLGMDAERPLAARIAGALAVTATAPIPWYWARRSLNQLSNHPLGTDREGVLAHNKQMLSGLAYAFGPDQRGIGTVLLVAAAGLLFWELVARRARGRADPLRGLAGFAILGLAGMVASFSATHVGEPLGGRFVVFAAMALVLAVLAAGQWRQAAFRARALTALGAALTAVALYRAGVKCRLAGQEQPASAFNVTITPSYWTGPPHEVDGLLVVAPPTYPWLRRSGLR
jgi:hypothetical protein